MKAKQDVKITEERRSYRLFYILSVILALYMVFSMYTSYQSFITYCNSYGVNPTDVWFTGFQSILAAAIPCLVYAAALYGIGYLIKISNK